MALSAGGGGKAHLKRQKLLHLCKLSDGQESCFLHTVKNDSSISLLKTLID